MTPVRLARARARRPWAATGDSAGEVIVWDYDAQAVVVAVNLQRVKDAARGALILEARVRQGVGEGAPADFSEAAAAASAVAATAPGGGGGGAGAGIPTATAAAATAVAATPATPADDATSAKRFRVGDIRAVAFIDSECARWRCGAAFARGHGGGGADPRGHWVAAACEQRVVLANVSDGEVVDVDDAPGGAHCVAIAPGGVVA